MIYRIEFKGTSPVEFLTRSSGQIEDGRNRLIQEGEAINKGKINHQLERNRMFGNLSKSFRIMIKTQRLQEENVLLARLWAGRSTMSSSRRVRVQLQVKMRRREMLHLKKQCEVIEKERARIRYRMMNLVVSVDMQSRRFEKLRQSINLLIEVKEALLYALGGDRTVLSRTPRIMKLERFEK